MEIGALIVAAGMSKRMGEFKPMLSIGSISVAQRVVATLSQAGVSKIAMLLMLVDETNSVRAAGRRMQLSYSSCWNIIRTLESQLSFSLIERSQGGAGGSQSRLTDRGRELLERYSAYEKRLKEQANALYDQCFGGLFE